ncbi:hypothetical protein Pcac1_g21402 [Phytophthora cactorum]|nr:hypothetical protein Pcac1_g21402 [Phytophthora cactorum]
MSSTISLSSEQRRCRRKMLLRRSLISTPSSLPKDWRLSLRWNKLRIVWRGLVLQLASFGMSLNTRAPNDGTDCIIICSRLWLQRARKHSSCIVKPSDLPITVGAFGS